MRIPFISLLAAGSIALGGCAYGGLGLGYGSDYGYGYGSPYYGYKYGSPYFGYGYGARYRGYGYGYDDPWYGGFGYRSPYFGWYNNYYYPGSGIYVYDTFRRPRVWSDRERAYWASRLKNTSTRTVTTHSPNWSGFSTRSTMSNSQRVTSRQQRMQTRHERQVRHDTPHQ